MSKTTYIYLNTYKINGNFYYYVGSHTWSGPQYVLDSSYQGSSSVAKQYHWVPVYQQFLKDITNAPNKFRVESEEIIMYLKLFGIAPPARSTAHKNGNFWVDQFHTGTMLNCHANTLEHCLSKAHSSEANQKRVETRKFNGSLQRWVKSTHTSTSITKMVNTNISKGNLAKFQKAGCSHQASLKSIKTRKSNGSYDKWQDAAHSQDYHKSHVKASSTRKGIRGNKYLVECNGFQGNLRQVLFHVFGHFRFECSVGRKFKSGVLSVEKEGFIFNLLCKE